MKKLLIGCGAVLVLGVIVLVVLGLTLPTAWSLERSIEIQAPPAEIHAQLVDLRTWEEWSSWGREADPTCVWTYGADHLSSEWKGDKHGTGKMVITEHNPATGLDYTLEFFNFKAHGSGKLRYTPAGAATRVTWTAEGDCDVPFAGLLVLVMKPVLADAFEQSLAGLKTRVEGRP